MPVTITGSKYSGGLTSVATNTANNSSATFIANDFVVQRIIALWNSTGTTYKGVAWIRQWLSSTQLELETPFIDKNGATVTQVTGDTYQVSKWFGDAIATGLAVSGNQVTITDGIIFGTAGSGNSVCFYDENRQISASTTNLLVFDFRGGLSVFGHLQNYANRTFINPCDIFITTTGDSNDQIKITNASSKFWWLGGTILGPSNSRLIGGTSTAASGVGTPGEWLKVWNLDTGADVMSPSDGGNWSSNPTDQRVVNLKSFITGQGIGLRWANGYTEGGIFYISGSNAYSVFGSDSAGSFAISALAGQYVIVQDCGTGAIKPSLWRANTAVAQTITYTNVVTPKRGHTYDASGGTANNSATGIFNFSGLFTGLINNSLLLVKNNGILSTIQNSSSASGNTATLVVEEARVTGTTETVTENAWICGFYFYGYTLISQPVATSTQTVNGGQSAKIVLLGGLIGQVIDATISQSIASTVAAYTVLTTFDQFYDYAQYYKALNTANAIYPNISTQLISSAAGNLNTLVAHNLIIDSTAASVFSVNTSTQTITIKPTSFISSGVKSDTFNLSPGKTLTFAQNGNKSSAIYSIPANGIVVVAPGSTDLTKSLFISGSIINASSGTAIVTVSDTTVVTAGTGVTLQSGIVPIQTTTTIAASISLRKASDNSLIASGTADASGNFTASYAYPGSTVSAILRVRKAGFVPFSSTVSITSAGLNASAFLAVDSNYNPTY